MKKLIYLMLFGILISCGDQATKKEATNQTKENTSSILFDSLKTQFIDELWELNPIWASYEGFHKYDELLPIPDEANRKAKFEFSKAWLKRLKAVQIESLESLDLIDYRLIENYLKSIAFYQKELKSWQWDASTYNLGGAFFQPINYKEKALTERLKAIASKLEKVEAYYQAAKSNLKQASRVHTELAIQQLEGSKSIFNETLVDSLEKAKLDADFKLDFREKVKKAVAAIDQFKLYLEVEILAELEEDDQKFRIGEKLFEKKFGYEIQSQHTAEEIFQKAVEEKEKLHDHLYRISESLWSKYFPDREKPGSILKQIDAVIDEVGKRHVHRDSFLTAIENQIPELQKFVEDNNLLSMDAEKPLQVRETPKYMRGVAGASISAPGPYDKNAETFYNVTPLDDYTEEEAESYLREYNHYTLQILNIHEAIPGHYTQLIYSNQSPSIIKSILGNGTMIEGWAVYAERMMLENNYGEEEELGLMYYKWNLRTVCNAILDYGVHVLNYTKEDAMQLLQKEAFQETAEAEGKWRRAKLSQVQLSSYFTGYYEIMELREELKKLKGEEFDLKSFHEEFLSYGSAPVKYIRKMMLENKHDNKNPA